MVGQVFAGPPGDPDFAAGRAEVDYALEGPWNGRPLGVGVRSLRLVRPSLRAGVKDGAISLGALDPLLEKLRARPPRPDARQPRVIVEDGRLRLATPYGPVDLRADARLEDGKLLALDARAAPAGLKGPWGEAAAGRARLVLTTRGDRAKFSLDLLLHRLEAANAELRSTRLRLEGDLPYPDFKHRASDGRVQLRLKGEADEAVSGGGTFRDLRLNGGFDGVARGWVDTLRLTGRGEASATVGAISAPGLGLTGVDMDLETEAAEWSRPGGDRASTRLRLEVQGDELRQGDLILRRIAATFGGRLEAESGRPGRLALTGDLRADGGYRGLGAPLASDVPQVAALKRSVRDFHLTAPGMTISAGNGYAVTLDQPARAASPTGAALVIAASRAPIVTPDGGRLQAVASGGGLPRVELVEARWRPAPGGLAADLALRAQGDYGPAIDARLETAGRLSVSGGVVAYSAQVCLPVRVARLELGENDVENAALRLCPRDAPLLRVAGGAWRLQGQVQGLDARASFLQARVEQVAGPLSAGPERGVMRLRFDLRAGRIVDAAPETRFHPLQLRGEASLAGETWRAPLTISDLAGRQVATADVRHDMSQGVGRVAIDTGDLVFAEGGLQPQALSPLAAAIGSPARGVAAFSGGFDWTTAGGASQGLLQIDRLDFMSPAGAVSGLSGDVTFSSLSPLTAPAGQKLTAAGIATVGMLTDAEVEFAIAPDGVQVDYAGAKLGGGEVSTESFFLPLAPETPWGGTLEIDGVQLAGLVEASPFGDKVDLQAKVDGVIPFQVVAQGFRISGGEAHAIEPGRLSIRREALTGVAASTADAPTAQTPNAFTDFAYQAMENLAFSELSARIDSLPQGRIGVVLRVKGKHQPPTRQEIRVPAADLISRRFLERELPLPSGTKVDLTLDTTLNLDQLLGDYAGFRRLRGSAPVQPAAAIPGPRR